jgi:hypothetical protein
MTVTTSDMAASPSERVTTTTAASRGRLLHERAANRTSCHSVSTSIGLL